MSGLTDLDETTRMLLEALDGPSFRLAFVSDDHLKALQRLILLGYVDISASDAGRAALTAQQGSGSDDGSGGKGC